MKNLMEIKKIATVNDTKRINIIQAMKLSLKNIVSSQNMKFWRYDNEKKVFFRALPISECDVFVYEPIRYQESGISYIASYDEYDNVMSAMVYVPDFIDFTNYFCKLSIKLNNLRESWKQKAAKVAHNYFERNKDDICSATLAYTSGITSRTFCLWSPKKSNESKEMVKCLGHLINGMTEFIDGKDFTPCFWSSPDSLREEIRLNKNYKLVISRNYLPDESMKYDWPEITAYFEMVDSDDLTYKNALSTIYYFNRCETNNHIVDFEEMLEKAEWTMQADKVTAIIPVIWEKDITTIIKTATKKYPNFHFENIGEHYVPLFDNTCSCISVTEK